MITGLGTDIAEVHRIQNAERFGKLSRRILSEEEMEYYESINSVKRKTEYLAGRFAAKEAYSKALGTGIGKTVAFKDIIILNDTKGAPYILNDTYAMVSISHSDRYAVATVIIQTKE